MDLIASDLERLFAECFLRPHRTRLVGGGDEPVYRPSKSPATTPNEVVYREDYFASALHEIAHWCLAGPERRRLEDYGYWYSPDGRNAEQQLAFEAAEARPQALEWIFSDACRFPFNLSADNLDGGFGPSERFEQAVAEARDDLLSGALPARAGRFLDALRAEVSGRSVISHSGLGT